MASCSVVIVVGAWFGALIAVVDCVVDGRWDFGWVARGFAIGAVVIAANEPAAVPSDPAISEEATGRAEM